MKRLDLQAIRGVAIFLVILFHLQPDAFSLGFVGVDMFFVLSGYLMAVILSKETFGRSSLYNFYSRRFRRIVPLCFTVIALVFTGTNFLLIQPDKVQLLEDIKWAVPFLTNIQYLYETKSYWDQVNDSRFFVHCWSLALEIQFYLIAPFIIFLSHRYSLKNRNMLIVAFILISSLFQVFSNSKVGYYLLSSRIWQFLLGILCYQGETSENVKKLPSKEKKICNWKCFTSQDIQITLVIFLAFCNFSFQGKEHIFRIISCYSVAYIIATSSPENTGPVLSNKILVFLGDISYTMYLVHWPIIIGYKYFYSMESLTFEDSLLPAVLILLVTLLVHYLIEKPIISLSLAYSISICALCVGFLCLTANSYLFFSKPFNPGEISEQKLAEIISWNSLEKSKGFFQQPCEPDNLTMEWTKFSDDPNFRCQAYANGSLNILVIGNSMAYRAYPKLHELFKGQYKELRLYARGSAVPLANDPDSYPEFTAATRIVVEQMKPDILWNIHGTTSKEFTSYFNETNKMEDKTFQQFQENLNFYSSYAKEIIIDLPYYWANIPAAYHIVKRLYLGVYDLSDLRISRQEVEKQQVYHKRRLLALNCNNCHFTNVENLFFEKDDDNEYYYLYDRKTLHAYTSDGNHLTPAMLDRIAPIYKKLIEKVARKLTLNKR